MRLEYGRQIRWPPQLQDMAKPCVCQATVATRPDTLKIGSDQPAAAVSAALPAFDKGGGMRASGQAVGAEKDLGIGNPFAGAVFLAGPLAADCHAYDDIIALD